MHDGNKDMHKQRTYMAVQLLDEGLGPVLLLMPLLGMCKGAPHTIVDHNIVLVSLQQSRTYSIAHRRPLKTASGLGNVPQHSCRQHKTDTSAPSHICNKQPGCQFRARSKAPQTVNI